MPKHLIFGVFGLIAGLAIGFFGANAINRNAMTASSAEAPPSAVQPVDPSTISQDGMQADVAATIAEAEAQPQNFAVQMHTGDLYAEIGKYDKAVEYYNRGLAIKPDDFQANVVIANAYFDDRKFEDAAKYYEKALAVKPNDVNVRTDYGTTFVERKTPDYDRAIKEYRSAMQLAPKNAPTLYYLGIAFFRKGDRQNADTILAELEKSDPGSELIARLKQNMSVQ